MYLRPETNLSNFSYSEKGSSLCNVLRVFGSEAADGSYVSILPPTPSVIAWILDNDTENSIDWNQKLSEVVYNEETKTEKTIYPLKDALTNFIENNYPLNTLTNDADAKTEKATIKEELDKAAIKKAFKDGVNTETGEYIPGITTEEIDSIKVKVEGREFGRIVRG